MFNKKTLNDILYAVKHGNSRSIQTNKDIVNLLTSIEGNLNLIELHLENIESKLTNDVVLAEDKNHYNLDYSYKILEENPKCPMYSMNSGEENNDLLKDGAYKSKYNIEIKSSEIDLNKVDWSKSYILLDYKGMSNYRLMLNQNNRSFSKHSDEEDNIYITRLNKLVLYLDNKYIEINLNIYNFDEDFNVVNSDHSDAGKWFYKKIEIDLDK